MKANLAPSSRRSGFSRRHFLSTGLVAAAAPLLPAHAEGKAGLHHEDARDIPLRDDADVVVCGAGPAGVAAAIAAARTGAKTRLFEAHGCLGGIWTSGLLCWILDHGNKAGCMAEILRRLEKIEARAVARNGKRTNAYDPEAMKFVLEDICGEAGVTIQYHTRVCAAVRGAGGNLTRIVTESKSGREAFAARCFIDCTGDGDLGAQAGCQFALGHPETGKMQPMSLMAVVAGIDPEEMASFYRDDDSSDWAGPKDRLRAAMEKSGVSPSYAKPSLFHLRDDLFALMTNHEYDVKGIDAAEVTRATLQARRELHQLTRGLRSLGGPWSDLKLVATAEQIGVREGRRLRGRYMVTTEDLRVGQSQSDAVCRVTFGVDVHSTDPKKQKGIEAAPVKAKPYDIPLRALIAQDVDGLLMAGRCISGDFIAHSSYRVTGNAVAMGEAAGAVAALAATSRRMPHEVEWRDVQTALKKTASL